MANYPESICVVLILAEKTLPSPYDMIIIFILTTSLIHKTVDTDIWLTDFYEDLSHLRLLFSLVL